MTYMIWVTKKKVTPYSALAPIYDRVMAHVNYKRWAAYIDEIVSRFRPASHWIVDLSCGTGTLCLLLEKYGYSVTGLDSSKAMLLQAARKISINQNRFICADLCSLPIAEQPDVVISLYDSMNYLLNTKMWRKCLSDIFHVLKDGGLFIFDVSTLFNSRKDFSRYVHKETFWGGSYFRKSTFDKKNNVQINYFEIKLANKPKTIFCETHHQRIRRLDEIVQFVDASPFSLLAGYKDFTFKPYSETCERVHFVLKKSDQHVRTS